MRPGAHAFTRRTAAEKAAAGGLSHPFTAHWNDALPHRLEDVEVHQPAEGMLVLDLAASLLYVQKRTVHDEEAFEAGFQVLYLFI